MFIPPLLAVLAVTEVVEVLGLVIGVQLLTGWTALPAVAAAIALVAAAPTFGALTSALFAVTLIGAGLTTSVGVRVTDTGVYVRRSRRR